MNLKDFKGKEKICMVTCYDFSFAKIIDGLVDCILVGDSLGMVQLGYKDTKSVTMQDMLSATAAVSRATATPIIFDMPIHTYDTKEVALQNAQLAIQAGAQAVKVEGHIPEIVHHLTTNNIPVQAHLGYLPQSEEKPTIHGKEREEQLKILQQAKDLEKAGASSLVLELLPASFAQEITNELNIPTIGIGSGEHCDGQVLVLHDLLGIYTEFSPKFVKKYANLAPEIEMAIKQYNKDVKQSLFPSKEQTPRE